MELRGGVLALSGVDKNINPGELLLITLDAVKVIQEVQVITPLFSPGG